MSIFNKKTTPARLNKVEPTHKKLHVKERVNEFWLTNKTVIGLFTVTICISILIFMMGFAAASKGYFSTEANQYQRLSQIVCLVRMVIINA